MKEYGALIAVYRKALMQKEIKRKEVINSVLTHYFHRKAHVFGVSASIDKTLHLIHDYIKKESVERWFGFGRILIPDDVKDI